MSGSFEKVLEMLRYVQCSDCGAKDDERCLVLGRHDGRRKSSLRQSHRVRIDAAATFLRKASPS